MKYILITGGVISGLGKGVSSSSLGHLLQLRGIEVTMIKIDPYLNIDAGTMSPYEHGEVFVLDDGSEVDLDLGTYERFLNIRLTKLHSITTGVVYQSVLEAERRGDYLGKTVQVVPHITDEIVRRIKEASAYQVRGKTPDVCMIELGGTVGDIESAVFLEALRQIRAEDKNDFCHVHVSLVPKIKEQKSKPTQHSFKELRHTGLSPDLIFCRCEEPIDEYIRDKISRFCMVPKQNVISVHDVEHIYRVPKILVDQKVPSLVGQVLNLEYKQNPVSPFSLITPYDKTVRVAMVGKYEKLKDSYLSVYKALFHACERNNVSLDLVLINSEGKMDELKSVDAILVPGGFGERGVQGKIQACKFARENHVPFLGICFGFQLAVIEYYRNVLNIYTSSEELHGKGRKNIFVKIDSGGMGGTMRKGLYVVEVNDEYKGKLVHPSGKERFRYRYEFHSNSSTDLELFPVFLTKPYQPVAFALKEHPFYVGTQYHPEFLSRLNDPHPVFVSFIKSAV